MGPSFVPQSKVNKMMGRALLLCAAVLIILPQLAASTNSTGNTTTGNTTTASSSTSTTGNSTATATTCTYGATSTCATRVTQSLTISSLTANTYTGNTKSTYECSYVKSIGSTYCTATTGTVTYLTGVQVSSSAARRAATITFVTDIQTSVATASAVQTAVATGVTAANLVSNFAAIKISTGWTTVTAPAAADVTVATAAFAGAASSAGMVIPSAIMVLLSP